MANRITNGSGRKLDAAAIARQWLERGVHCTPVKAGGKKPLKNNWNKLIIAADQIDEYFKPGYNVGGLWGEASNWVVDVDLDCDEATRAARWYLPTETFGYGRESRPWTHYLVRSRGVKTTRLEGPDGRIVELLSTGAQSVLPGSMHPDHERYHIDNDGPFIEMDSDDLLRRVYRIGAVSLLAPSYKGGNRHDFASALAGALIRDGWSDDDARIAVLAMVSAAGDNSDDEDQRRRTVDHTIKSARNGSNTYGWPTLKGIVPPADLSKAREWFRESYQEAAPKLRIRIVRKETKETIPASVLAVPSGLVADIMTWSRRSMLSYHPILALSGALTSVALLTENKFLVSEWETPLQPYSMMLAPTAGGKESAMRMVKRLAAKAAASQHLVEGFQSFHSLLDRLSATGMACWLWDEAGRRLGQITRSKGLGPDAQVMDWLVRVYGMGNDLLAAMPARHNPIPEINHPFLVVLAASQPDALMKALSVSDQVVGLINRMILFDNCDQPSEFNDSVVNTFDSSIEAQIRAMALISRPDTGQFRKIRFERTVEYARFRDYRRETSRRVDPTGSELWKRANQNALILAGLLAVSRGPLEPVITTEIGDWARGYMDWSIGRWQSRMGEGIAENQIERGRKKILGLFDRMGEYIGEKSIKRKYRELLKKRLMPKAVISNKTGGMDLRDRDNQLRSLVEADLIGERKEDGVTVYWLRSDESDA